MPRWDPVDTMLRTAFWYAGGWACLALSIPMLLVVRTLEQRGQMEKGHRLTDRMTVWICRTLFRLSGSRIRITGQEHVPAEGAVLFVGNHQGHMDSVIIHGYIDKPKGFISIVEVLKIPILSAWMRHMRCVFLDRNDARQSAGCISQAVDHLRSGQSMVVFPEGRLSDCDDANEFKKGWLRLAVKSGVPIVPVHISGSYRILAKDGSRVKPALIVCSIRKPVMAGDLKKTDETAFVEKIRDIIFNGEAEN